MIYFEGTHIWAIVEGRKVFVFYDGSGYNSYKLYDNQKLPSKYKKDSIPESPRYIIKTIFVRPNKLLG